ncbi:DVUA0089 family protein [Occultella glacieicola]|uniref:DVUA0089 family protein n=1 Tax=Occultella glacieicola TaxID=2518684 RepID=UPI0014055B20|nr:DVUA0089 family protein [Occultella glacieicola]
MTTPAGWFPDPSGADQLRYWNGATWSDQVAPNGPQPSGYGQPSSAPGYGQSGVTEPYGHNAGGPSGQGAGGALSGYAAAPAAYASDTTSAYGSASAFGGAASGAQPGGPGYYGPAGAPPRSGNQTPVIIAVAAVAVLVIAVAAFFGVRALTGGGDPGPTAGPTAAPPVTSGPTAAPTPTTTPSPTSPPTQGAPDSVGLGATSSGVLPADGTWDGVVSVTDPGVYAFIGHAPDGFDLTLTLLDASGREIAFNDDAPGDADLLVSNNRDALLGRYLEPGDYTVRVAEYYGAETGFDLTADFLDVVTEVPTDGTYTIDVPADNLWLGYVPVAAQGMVTIDVRSTTDADPVLTVVHPDGAEEGADDRGVDTAAEFGGGQYDPYLTFAVEPGVYLVMVSDWSGAASSASISITVD